MVQAPNPDPATKETAVHAEYCHHLLQTQGSHKANEARMPTEQEVEDAHSAARLRRSLAHRDSPSPLLLAHHRLCGRSSLRPGEASGLLRPPKTRPETVAWGAGKRAYRASGGRWVARLSWLAALALELQAPGRGVVQGASHSGEPGDHSPRAPSPGLPLEKAAPRPARERLRGAARTKTREARRRPANGGRSGVILPGRDEPADQPQSRFLLDAQRKTGAPSHSRDKPQGVDQWGAQLPYGPLTLGCGKAQGRRAVHRSARGVAKDLPLPQTVAPGGGQRLKPYQQTGREVRRGFRRTYPVASVAFVLSREQSDRVGVVDFA